MFFHKSWTNEQFLYNLIAYFLCQYVCVVIFIFISKSFASTSQIGKIIDKAGVQLKGVKMNFLCSMWNTSIALWQSYVKLTTLVILLLTIYTIQSTIIYFILPFVARYPYFRVDTNNLLPTSPTHHSSLSYFAKGGERLWIPFSFMCIIF